MWRWRGWRRRAIDLGYLANLDIDVVAEHVKIGVVADDVVRGFHDEKDAGEGNGRGIQRPCRDAELGSIRPVGEDKLEDRVWRQDGACRAEARGIGRHTEDVNGDPIMAMASSSMGLMGPRLDGALERWRGQDAGGGEGMVPIDVAGEVH
jgi:hypothetical protein